MCVRIQYLSFSFWLTSLCVRGSEFIHLMRTDSNSFLFHGWIIFHCVYVPQLLYPFICQWASRLLPCSSCVNSAAMNNGIYVYFSIFVSFEYMSRSGIAGSWGGFIPNFLRNLHTVFPEKALAAHSSILTWRIQGQRSLVGCCLWGRTESDMTEAT